MTHSGGKPHTNVGDFGQRFEVQAEGYPRPGWNRVGWADTVDGANYMADAIRKAPSCTGARIVDREVAR